MGLHASIFFHVNHQKCIQGHSFFKILFILRKSSWCFIFSPKSNSLLLTNFCIAPAPALTLPEKLFGSSCTLEKCQSEKKRKSLTFISVCLSCTLHPQPHEAPDPALSLKILSRCLIERDDLLQMQARGAVCCLLCPITLCHIVCPI